MTQALGIGASSINADMTAIDALAQNIANAQTPGYIAETANLATLPSASNGAGSGVEVISVSQATNALLSANDWQAQGALSNLSAVQETLTAIENVFPLSTQGASSTSPTASSGISGLLSGFWSSWDAIAQSPSSAAPRTEVVNSAQGVVTALHEAAYQLSQISQSAVSQLTDQLTQVNNLLTQVGNLNQSILRVGTGTAANSLEDQLQAAIGTLSQLAGVDVHMQSNGTANLTIGGIAVVQGATASTLESVLTTSGSLRYAVKLTTGTGTGAGAGTVTVPVSSGSIAGLLSSVNTHIPTVQGNLDSVAQQLAATVNTTLQDAYRATGKPATQNHTTPSLTPPAAKTPQYWQMFATTGGATTGITAANITVSSTMVAHPSLIAVASKPATARAAANNGAIAQQMAELGTTHTGPDAKYQTLVQSVGSVTQSVNDQLQAQTAVATQAKQALQAVSGVNVTEELTSLLSFQQNYEASAKVLDTVDTTVQALLQAV